MGHYASLFLQGTGRSIWIKRPRPLSVCRKSGLRHFFEVFIAPLRLRRDQELCRGNPCYARLLQDLTRTPGHILSLRDNSPCVAKSEKASVGGKSRAPPVAGERGGKPSEQGSARRPHGRRSATLRTALRPPSTPRGFLDKLKAAKAAFSFSFMSSPCRLWERGPGGGRKRAH